MELLNRGTAEITEHTCPPSLRSGVSRRESKAFLKFLFFSASSVHSAVNDYKLTTDCRINGTRVLQ